MDKKQKIKAIYKKIADEYVYDGIYQCNRVWEAWDVGTMTIDDFESYTPVMFGDIWHFLEIAEDKSEFFIREIGNLNLYWEYKQYKLEDQNDECIDYIYNLIFE